MLSVATPVLAVGGTEVPAPQPVPAPNVGGAGKPPPNVGGAGNPPYNAGEPPTSSSGNDTPPVRPKFLTTQ